MNSIINAIRTGRLYEAQEMIREGLNRQMLTTVHSQCKPVMKEAYGGPGAGIVAEDELEDSGDVPVEEACDCEDDDDDLEEGLKPTDPSRKNRKPASKKVNRAEGKKAAKHHESVQVTEMTHSQQVALMKDTLSNDDESSDEDIVSYWIGAGIPKADANLWIKKRDSYLKHGGMAVHESLQLDEARDRASWQAYLGKLNAGVGEKQHAIAAARTRLADLRKAGAKPERLAKVNDSIKKKSESLANLKRRIADAHSRYTEWLKKESEKAKKARERAKKKNAPKKPTVKR